MAPLILGLLFVVDVFVVIYVLMFGRVFGR